MNKAAYILIFFCLIVYSQESTNDNYIFEGNKKIEQNDFIGAEMDYRNSLSNNPNYPKGKIYPNFSVFGSKTVRENLIVYRLPLIPRGKGTKFMLGLNYISYFFTSFIHSN